MTTYTPTEVLMPVGLDELGLKYSLNRLPEELLSDYRRRLLLEARDPGDPSGDNLIRGVNRKVGLFESPVFTIDVVLDANGDPLAADPFVEITSSYLRAYSDYASGTVDVEIPFDTQRWLINVPTAFSASTFFSVVNLSGYEAYLPTNHLRIENSTEYVNGRQLRNSYQNTLRESYIKDLWFSSLTTFREEKSSRSAVTELGDYWVDYTSGTIISFDLQGGTCYYTYRRFPFTVYWQPARVMFFNDKDIDYLIKDDLMSDASASLSPAALNSYGAWLTNKVLAAHSLGWGE